MLILSRKIGQSIVIGNGIEVTVVEMRGDQVRLGIAAPREVPVNRKEVLDRSAPEATPMAEPFSAENSLSKSAPPPATGEVLAAVAEHLTDGLHPGPPGAVPLCH